MIKISLQGNKKIYFASDFHLGVPSKEESLKREKKIVRWLTEIAPNCEALFLVGDIFDFWFEYKAVVPKGFIRLQGKLAEMADNGIPIYLFRGNHDMWLFDYFEEEIGATIFDSPQTILCNGKKLFVHHGDGLGTHDKVYKIFRKIFRNKVCQWLYARVHPNLGVGFANYNSRSSRIRNSKQDEVFLKDKEHLWHFCKTVEMKEHFDYYIMGHRHLPLYLPVADNSYYVNLGEWVNYSYYGEFDGDKLHLKAFDTCPPFFTEEN